MRKFLKEPRAWLSRQLWVKPFWVWLVTVSASAFLEELVQSMVRFLLSLWS